MPRLSSNPIPALATVTGLPEAECEALIRAMLKRKPWVGPYMQTVFEICDESKKVYRRWKKEQEAGDSAS